MTTLDLEPLTVAVPIREEPPGVFRVGEGRVLLELVLRAFKAGATPESIVQSYDTLIEESQGHRVFSEGRIPLPNKPKKTDKIT